ncbi:type II toxin-antitoxin system PemK/MazF family toxin [Mesorhizobium sp. LHD-90]|uniref:type II toxin-antitoxin system PemK/MazF family toxin n=1 Tax=Mesorhizobium sp. LHD-90 TaxID=3071414 RepID=UPI0027E1DB40|nr:type II toxin-antitoxin system PemK/MazF family toxin [Mesorhizobium sp. LHD-90]MDQ6435915.1 type II toxin-antitoxin system PemK/MazF family toxin [Mesorhizobium sp. LHD-90]
MKRGEIWTLTGGGDYARKPRPAVVVQEDSFDGTASIVVCTFTTTAVDAPLYRIAVNQSPSNGLREASSIMVDKIAGVPRDKLGKRIGILESEHLDRLDRALLVFLGLTTTSSA